MGVALPCDPEAEEGAAVDPHLQCVGLELRVIGFRVGLMRVRAHLTLMRRSCMAFEAGESLGTRARELGTLSISSYEGRLRICCTREGSTFRSMCRRASMPFSSK